MSRRCGLKWDLLGNDPVLGKTQKHGLECKKRDNQEGREMRQRRMEFHILNHVLYLIISPSADQGPGGALKAKINQRQPLWRAAMIPSHSCGQQPCWGGTATRQRERVGVQDAVVPVLLPVEC